MKFILTLIYFQQIFLKVYSATLALPTNIEKYPFQISVQVQVNGEYMHICGGSIISSTCVITAGHCVTESRRIWGYVPMQIVAGITKLSESSTGQAREIIDQVVHENYQDNVGPNDLALLKFNEPLEWNSKVAQVELPTKNPTDLSLAVITGWGAVYPIYNIFKSSASDDLHEGYQFILPMSVCKIQYIPTSTKPDETSNVCSSGLASTCNGDSGGPLSYQGTLIGVVSWGSKLCTGFPSVYTNVYTFVDWINNNL